MTDYKAETRQWLANLPDLSRRQRVPKHDLSRRPNRQPAPQLSRSRSPPGERPIKAPPRKMNEDVEMKDARNIPDATTAPPATQKSESKYTTVILDSTNHSLIPCHHKKPDIRSDGTCGTDDYYEGNDLIDADGKPIRFRPDLRCQYYHIDEISCIGCHLQSHRTLIYDGKLPRDWTPISHTAADIKDVLLEHWKVPYEDWSPERKAARNNLVQLWAKDEMQDKNGAPWPQNDSFSQYLILLDEMFYGGKLRDYTTTEVFKHVHMARASVGQCVDHPTLKGHSFLLKLSDRVKPHQYVAPKKMRRQQIMGTLLHEMIHAVFYIYTCHGYFCHTLKPSVLGIGTRHHGPFFEELATRITELALELPIWCGCFLDQHYYPKTGLHNILEIKGSNRTEADHALYQWQRFMKTPFPRKITTWNDSQPHMESDEWRRKNHWAIRTAQWHAENSAAFAHRKNTDGFFLWNIMDLNENGDCEPVTQFVKLV